jgi:hypothetical protein
VHTLRQTTNQIEEGPASIAQTIEVLDAYEDWIGRHHSDLARERPHRLHEYAKVYDNLLKFLNLPLTTSPKEALIHVRAQIKSLKEAAIYDITQRAQTGKLCLQSLKGYV